MGESEIHELVTRDLDTLDAHGGNFMGKGDCLPGVGAEAAQPRAASSR